MNHISHIRTSFIIEAQIIVPEQEHISRNVLANISIEMNYNFQAYMNLY